MTVVEERSRTVLRSQVEPRIVERRRSVQREQSRRRRRGLVVLGAIALSVVTAIVVVLSPVLDVDRIDISGSVRLDAEEVAELSGIDLGAPMVSANLPEARAALRGHRLIAAAQVTRTWPGSIEIVIVEEQPLVLLRHGGGASVLSRSGSVLEAEDAVGAEPRASIVSERALDVETGDRVEGTLRAAVAMVDQLTPALRQRIVQVVLDQGGAVELELDDGATVRFGRLDDVPAKLVALETALAQVEPRCLERLDVTEPQLATASRVPGCDVPAPTVAIEDAAGESSGSASTSSTEADDGD